MDALAYNLDTSSLWTWFLLFTRMTGLFIVMPGVGSSDIPIPVRLSISIIISAGLTMSGLRAPEPEIIVQGCLMLCSEFLIGYTMAVIPLFIIGALSITGQVVSGSIGLGMANLIDPSIGQNVAVLARIQSMIGTLIFLLLDGHHVLIRAAAGGLGDPQIGTFLPAGETAMFILQRFSEAFELSIICAAPVLVSILITQFVLGIVTKAVPQVNIFIISLPLTIGLGLYVTVFTLDGMVENLVDEFRQLEELTAQLLTLDK